MLIRKLYIVTFFMLAISITSGIGQTASSYPLESISIDTDRDIYYISDQIWFVASTLNESNIPQKTSSVIYVELINKTGKALVQQTYLNQNGTINGYISVPDTVRSGLFYLRAYTSYMKNYPLENYAHKFIQIIHPGKAPDLTKQAQQKIQSWRKNNISNTKTRNTATDKKPNISIENKTITQQTVVDVEIENYSENIDKMWCSISAKVLNFPQNVSHSLDSLFSIKTININQFEKLKFKPEVNYHTINGKVNGHYPKTDEDDQQIVMFLNNELPHFYTTNLNDNKQFSFNIPISDIRKREVVLQVNEADSIDQIELSPVYDQRMPNIEMDYFYLDSSLSKAYDKTFIQWQLELIHRKNSNKDITKNEADSIYRFYNPTRYHINPSEYHLDLQSPQELYHEIGQRVKIKGSKGNYSLVILHNKTNNPIGDNPLILIDGCPVSDANQVMQIPVKNINFFEIVDTPYSIDKEVYDGIVQIVTKNFKRDLPTPANAYRTVHQFFTPNAQFQHPEIVKNRAIPFIKNTLYWNHQMDTLENFTFYTGENIGKYVIHLDGIMKSGEKFHSEIDFDIISKN